MKRPIQEGDRVRVYGHLGSFVGVVMATGQTVNSRYGAVAGMLLVENSDGHRWYQHPRQCRRLKPKKVIERIRSWVVVSPHGNVCIGKDKKAEAEELAAKRPGDRVACLVEIREGEVVVDRTKVVDAWGNLDSMPGDLDKLLKQLGLDSK